MGSFLREQLFGMKWLDALCGRALRVFGLDTASRLGGSLRFFLYDTLKITLLLCVLIFFVSFIQSFFPPERSRRILSRFRGLGANTAGALLGTVTPFCSCSSIPIFMGFTGAGLPLSVTFSFLISSPMVDLGSFVLLMSIFGVRIAAAYVLLGLAIAVAGGTLIGRLGLEEDVADFVRAAGGAQPESPALRVRDRLRFALEQVRRTLRRVFPWLLAGVGTGALIHNWIPQTWVEAVLGGRGPFGPVLAVLAGVPMYADIFGAVPVAEALLAKGARLGTVLSFMMAVTTLSLPSLILLRKAVRPRLLCVFAAVCTAGIFLVGCAFNALEPLLL